MEVTEQQSKPRVVVVDSLQSWEFYVTQAKNQNCPVVVHFTASWCMPSVAMNPFFEELASNYPHIMFLTVDVDDVKVIMKRKVFKKCGTYDCVRVEEVATRMEVKAMPTFLLMKDGAPVDRLVGANPEEIRKRVDGLNHSIGESVAVA